MADGKKLKEQPKKGIFIKTQKWGQTKIAVGATYGKARVENRTPKWVQ